MITREEIDIILTEYNFDRMSFDEAKKKLLDVVDTHHKQKMEGEQGILKKAFDAAREGRTIGGMGGIKQYTYESFKEWFKSTQEEE